MIYAVNKRTKEHRVSTPGEPYSLEWHFEEADPDGWIEWHGGECPLPEGVPYETKHESGAIFQGEKPETFGVHWRGEGCDAVTAYRPILATKASHPGTMAGPDKCRSDGGEWPAWDGEGLPPVGCECEYLYSEGASWRKGICVGHHNAKAVIVDLEDEGAECCPPSRIRPIRSGEDRAVEEMADVMREADGAVLTGRTQESIARALHRAGYRKTGDT